MARPKKPDPSDESSSSSSTSSGSSSDSSSSSSGSSSSSDSEAPSSPKKKSTQKSPVQKNRHPVPKSTAAPEALQAKRGRGRPPKQQEVAVKVEKEPAVKVEKKEKVSEKEKQADKEKHQREKEKKLQEKEKHRQEKEKHRQEKEKKHLEKEKKHQEKERKHQEKEKRHLEKEKKHQEKERLQQEKEKHHHEKERGSRDASKESSSKQREEKPSKEASKSKPEPPRGPGRPRKELESSGEKQKNPEPEKTSQKPSKDRKDKKASIDDAVSPAKSIFSPINSSEDSDFEKPAVKEEKRQRPLSKEIKERKKDAIPAQHAASPVKKPEQKVSRKRARSPSDSLSSISSTSDVGSDSDDSTLKRKSKKQPPPPSKKPDLQSTPPALPPPKARTSGEKMPAPLLPASHPPHKAAPLGPPPPPTSPLHKRRSQAPKMRPTAMPKAAQSSEESEVEKDDGDRKDTTPRKRTRSHMIRKSKVVHGGVGASDSETDAAPGDARGAKFNSTIKKPGSKLFPAKKLIPSGSRVKNKKANWEAQEENEPVQERRCPVSGCDSSGHISGMFPKHVLRSACPVHFNLSKEAIQRMKLAREQREKELLDKVKTVQRKHGGETLTSSIKGVTNPELKEACTAYFDARTRAKDRLNKERMFISMPGNKDRVPDLRGLTPSEDLDMFMDALAAASAVVEKQTEPFASCKRLEYIELGKYEIRTWYHSPYPEEKVPQVPKLFMCEYCLMHMQSSTPLRRHMEKCVWRHPPGDEIYRKDKLSVWEVDGRKQTSYCQNLCLLAKLFLDHKTLYFDVEPFLFYILTHYDSEGHHIIGYFSKEKSSFLNYNVSCIMILPPHQRMGYGRLLIDLSYLLTRIEGKIGSPEKPLSDLGLISYRNYWTDIVLNYMCKFEGHQVSFKDLSQDTGIQSSDIVSTLQALGLLKYWKGRHIIIKRQDILDDYLAKLARRKRPCREIDPKRLLWSPYLVRSNQT